MAEGILLRKHSPVKSSVGALTEKPLHSSPALAFNRYRRSIPWRTARPSHDHDTLSIGGLYDADGWCVDIGNGRVVAALGETMKDVELPQKIEN